MAKKRKAQIASFLPLVVASLIIILLIIIYLFFEGIFFIGKEEVELIKERIDKKTENYNLLYSIIYSELNDKEKNEIERIGNANYFYELFYLYLNSSNEEKDQIKKVIKEKFDNFLSKYDFEVYLRNETSYDEVFEIRKLTTISWFINGAFLNYLQGGPPGERISKDLALQLQTSSEMILPYKKNKFLVIYLYSENE